jgi:undecaprenyl-diphosphatase
MDVLTALLLGIIQGITEWLPVSSSGHLVIAQHFAGVENPVLFDAVVHLGTLFAVLLATWKFVLRITKASLRALRGNAIENIRKDMDAMIGYGAVMATIPIVIVGLIFQSYIEESFNSITVVAISLPITGLILFSVKGRDGKESAPNFKKALIIGTAQTFALLPGISRSGTTIVAGIHSGLKREDAAKFSFLMAILAIAGAGALQIYHAVHNPQNVDIGALITGFLASFIVGYLSIKALLKIVVTDKFHYFAYYCWIVSALLWIYLLCV